ncbi:MAG TPA: hypothetical protein VGP72_34030 [Planctomycetota bacterium]|jgi:hypothetical protein
MRVSLLPALLLLVAVPPLTAAEGDADAPGKELRGLPKISARTKISKEAEINTVEISRWAHELIATKEKRADKELEQIKKKAAAAEKERLADEQDRRRRQSQYEQSWGTLGPGSGRERSGVLHIKLDFTVPEIDAYRLAIEACHHVQGAAAAIAESLSSLDRDGDGKLAGEEYKDAAAVVAATLPMFQKLDSGENGYLTEESLYGAKNAPATLTAAMRAGRPLASAAGYRIKPFDKTGKGELDIDERKAMSMAFVELSVRMAKDAEFYKVVMDNLISARAPVAERFADVEVAP